MNIRLLVFFLVTSQLSISAYAFNIQFLEDAPASKFDDQDWNLLVQAVDTALEGIPRGEVLYWENEKSGHLGSVTMMGSKLSNGQLCRYLRVYNEVSPTTKGESIIKFCKQENGEWKIVTRSPSVNKD